MAPDAEHLFSMFCFLKFFCKKTKKSWKTAISVKKNRKCEKKRQNAHCNGTFRKFS